MDCKLAVLLLLGLSSAFSAEFHDVGPADVGTVLRQLVSDGNSTSEPTTTEAADISTTTEAADVSTTEAAEGNKTTTEEADEGSTTMAETTASPESTTMAETTASTGGGETTTIQEAMTTTTPAAEVVNLAMTVSGLDYAVLQANSNLKAAVIGAIKSGVVQELNSQVPDLNLTESNVETTLRAATARRLQGVRGLQSSTGVVAESVVTLPATSDASASTVASTVTTAASALGSTVTSKIQAVGNIGSVTVSGRTIGVSGVVLTTTTPAAKVVNLAMTVIGLDYAVLQADSALRAAVISAIKLGIVQELNSQVKALNLTESDVETTLREAVARRLQGVRGLQSSIDIGVVAESVVALPATSDASRVASIVKTTASALASTVSSKIQAVGKIASATLSGVKLAVVGVTAAAATPAPPTQSTTPTTTRVVYQTRTVYRQKKGGAARAEAVAVSLFAASLLTISLV